MDKNFFSKVKHVFKKLILLEFRTNIIISVCLFVLIFLVSVSVYGLFNFKEVQEFKENKDLEILTLSLDKTVLDFEKEITEKSNIKELAGELKSSDVFKNSSIIIMEKAIVVYSDKDITRMESLLEDNSLKKRISDQPDNNAFIYKSGSGKPGKYIVCTKVKSAQLVILAVMPYDFLRGYNFPTAKYILFSTLIIILITAAVFVNFKKRIYNPIIKIEKAINGILEGEMDFQIEVDNKSDLYPISKSINIMVAKLKDLISREYTEKILRKQAELDALQSQINPHFLYNTLESIRGQALNDGVENIARMTKALSNLFRYSISKKGNLVTLGEELKNVDNYLMIQQYRFNNKFNIKKIIEGEENDDIMRYKLPKLIIQPIVENAIYHGLETKSGKGDITIKAYITEKRLIICVEDNGTGIEDDKVKVMNNSFVNGTIEANLQSEPKTTEIGLLNVNERIKLNFGNKYGLRVYSTLGVGTTVEVVIPLIAEDKSTV